MNQMNPFVKTVAVLVIIVPIIFAMLFLGVPGLDPQMGDTVFNASATPVVEVGDIKVGGDRFQRLYYDTVSNRSQDGEAPTALEMAEDGTLGQILDYLADQALLQDAAQQRFLKADRQTLQEELKEKFTDEEGNFYAAGYNQWVQRETKAGADWDALYDDLASDLNADMYQTMRLSGAYVQEDSVRDQFRLSNTRISVDYLRIEPEISLTPEEVVTYFDVNRDRYMTLEARAVDFIVLSLEPADPEEMQLALERARAGEDFAELAKEYSVGPTSAHGGALGWIGETDAVPEFQEALFTQPVGVVGEPVRELAGIHIYLVEEERQALDGTREIHVREIVFRPQLSDAERTDIAGRAQQIQQDLTGDLDLDLEAVATREGLDIFSHDSVSGDTEEIVGVFDTDLPSFTRGVVDVEEGGYTGVIVGRRGLYIARVNQVIEPQPMELEDDRERVEADAESERKISPEYMEEVASYADRIASAGYTSLEEVQAAFPELNATVGTTGTFGSNDFFLPEGIFWNSPQIIQLLDGKEAGEMAGPVADMQGGIYFVALKELTPPTAKQWADVWPERRDIMMERARTVQQRNHLQDYLAYLREKAIAEDRFLIDIDAAFATIGVGSTEEFLEQQKVEEAAAAEDVPAESDSGAAAEEATPES